MRKLTTLSLALLAASSYAKQVSIQSPNGDIEFILLDHNNAAQYQVNFNDKSVIDLSNLGFHFKDAPSMGEGFKITKVEKNNHKSEWQQPWGERETVVDHHNELVVTFKAERELASEFNLRARIFDDGIGFRYEVPTQDGVNGDVVITDELTEFAISGAEQSTAYWIPARGWNRYEYVYNTTSVFEAAHTHTPMTMVNPNGVHLSIHEAALIDYAGMTLNQRRPGTLKADLTPWSDGDRVKKTDGFNTPWRTVQISQDAVGLLNSDIILNLNEPNKLGDVSWVEPGKYVGIWWGMHINENTWGSGEKHGATTDETIRYLDFAAKHGFDGVLVEGWNIGWDGNWFFNGDVFSFTESYPDFDIEKIAAHSKKVGARLIGHHETSGNVTNYRNQMEDAFKLYQKSGVSQIKTGYVADGGNIKRIDENGIARKEWHDGQFMSNEYLYNIELAAKYKLSINTHEPIKDTGLRRTYPNWITREGARGQEFNAWGTPPNPPEHAAMLPFTRMLSGPMDFTPGIFDMSFNGLGADTNRPQTTLAKQLALYVVLYSPIQMAADLPRNYEANLPAFQFIKDVPADWKESKAIAGAVGDYVAFARKDKHSEDWYLGALTDEEARTLALSLDFLSPDTKYIAQIYRDGEKANWVDMPYEIVIEEKTFSSKDTFNVKLATSGGVAVRFKPAK